MCLRVSLWNPGQSHEADAGFCLPVAAAVLRGSFRWRKWLIFHAFQLALPQGTAGLGCMPVLPRHHSIARPVLGAQPGCNPRRGRGTQRGRLCAGVSGARGLVCCRPAGSSPRRASARATCSPSRVLCWTLPLSPPPPMLRARFCSADSGFRPSWTARALVREAPSQLWSRPLGAGGPWDAEGWRLLVEPGAGVVRGPKKATPGRAKQP